MCPKASRYSVELQEEYLDVACSPQYMLIRPLRNARLCRLSTSTRSNPIPLPPASLPRYSPSSSQVAPLSTLSSLPCTFQAHPTSYSHYARPTSIPPRCPSWSPLRWVDYWVIHCSTCCQRSFSAKMSTTRSNSSWSSPTRTSCSAWPSWSASSPS